MRTRNKFFLGKQARVRASSSQHQLGAQVHSNEKEISARARVGYYNTAGDGGMRTVALRS